MTRLVHGDPPAELIEPYEDRTGAVGALTFSPDGRYLATTSHENAAWVWELSSGQEVARLPHDSLAFQIVFTPDGRYLATAGLDKVVKIWEVPGFRPIATLPQSGWLGLATSPDSRYLATNGGDNAVRIWLLPEGRLVATLVHEVPLYAIAFDRDGSTRLWRMADFTQVSRHLAFEANPWAVAFMPDLRYVVTGQNTGAIRVWHVEAADLQTEACARLTRNLTTEEWGQKVGPEPYRKTCPNLP